MIYFDNNATTAIAPEVAAVMRRFIDGGFVNPSSAYRAAGETKLTMESARASVAELVGASTPEEMIFTSGGTESDNWAILGALECDPQKRHIITTRVEHEAVRKLCVGLEKKGYEVTWLEVDSDGAIDLDSLRKALRPDTAVVSVMMANNETGILFPVEEIADIVKANSSAFFHVDGVNAVGKLPIFLAQTQIDLFSLSAHKFHGPKGIGALYVRTGASIPSLMVGGGQESGRRAGTEAVHQIAGMGKAAELVSDFSEMIRVRELRDELENAILTTVSVAKLNGTADRGRRLPNTSNISFTGMNGEMILAKLDDLGVCVSTGSACNSAEHASSPVLHAMGIPYSDAMGAIRFSLGRYNTKGEVFKVSAVLPSIIEELKAVSG